MLEMHGGVSAARQLLRSPGHPEGLTKLWELGRLDLSMEALVLREPWIVLFNDDERRIARKRLHELGYGVTKITTKKGPPSRHRLHPKVGTAD
jgi:hypothetical protein